MRALALALAATGCSFLIDPPTYDVCADSHGPVCDGDDLVVCQGDLDVRTSCAGGCDAVWAACMVPSCGNGATDEGELCDDGNRESGDGCRADCAKLEGCGDQIVDFGEPCDDGNEVDGDGCDCRPADTLVNSTYEGDQERAFVAASPEGVALIVWEDESGAVPDTSGLGVRARLVRGTAPVGEDLVVNSQTDFNQEGPRVAASASGDGFLVVWTDSSGAEGDPSGTAVRGRLIDSSGVAGNPDFVIPSTIDADQKHPTVVAMPGGGYAVVWEDHSEMVGDTDGAAIRLRLLDAEGTPASEDVVVNTTTTMAQTEPGLAVNADGLLLVVWQDYSRGTDDPSDSAIRGRRVDSSGSFLGDDFAINTTTPRDQLKPNAVALPGGDFLVMWTDASGSPDDEGDVRARRVPASGAPAGTDVVLNTTPSGGQELAWAAASGDAIAVVWEDKSLTAPDVSESAIRFRWFDAEGEAIDPSDRLLNTITKDDQGEPSIAPLPGGSVIVVWEDESATLPDDRGQAVRMKIVAPP